MINRNRDRQVGGPRLVVRIYLGSLLIAAVIGLCIVAIANLVIAPSFDPELKRFGQFLVATLADRLGDPEALAEESRQIGASGPSVIIFDKLGKTLAVVGSHSFAPLSSALLDQLERERALAVGRHPTIAVAIPKMGPLQAYGLVEIPHPTPGGAPLMILVVVVLLLLAGSALVFSRSIAVPLGKRRAAALALGSGDLEARTRFSRKDEFGDVGRAFDEMAAQIAELLRSQQEMLANVSHELRSPLARVRVALDLAIDGDTEARRDALSSIGGELIELDTLVGDILTAARLDLGAGGASGMPTVLDIEGVATRDLVNRAVARFRDRYPNPAVEAHVPEGIPETFKADPTLIQRVLDNLLDNAGKYSEPKTTVVVRADADSEQLSFAIKDSGIGIDQADIARLFTPFFRTDRSRSRSTGGVGLGLALAKKIVDAHGGTIDIRSDPANGTTVRFLLPLGQGRQDGR